MQQYGMAVVNASRLFDIGLVGVSLWLSSLIYDGRWDEFYSITLLSAVGLFVLFSHLHNLYSSWSITSLRQQAVKIWVVWLMVVLGLLLLGYATKTSETYSRLIMMTWFLITPLVLVVWRIILKQILGYLYRGGKYTRSVAIVGARELGAQLARSIINGPWMGLKPIGFFDDRSPVGSRPLVNDPLPIIGNFDALLKLAREGGVDVIYIALPMKAEERIKKLVGGLSDTTASVYLVPDFFMSDLMKSRWSNVGSLPAISIFETPFYGVDGVVKRIEDFILATIILVLIALPMLLIAIGIKYSSPGSIIFKQNRYGLRGDKIEVWKFRTMTVSENSDHLVQAKKHDSRIYPFGAFLRRTSLDELPQFINVLQGRMSIVGPRPHAVVHNEQYRKLISGYMLRHKVRPGITGLAQIEGWRGETDTLDKMQRRVEYDLAYIRRWSVWFDLKIIFLTIFKGFINKNAY
ncbi:MAG: undecaprenyl-phosphate glucose phosphotransferase [Gammaproteobacteria bacterium]|nr:undecaprenyl-phosphate glucose phosphotransferase [Gammaproteobacteria bacterium]